MSRTNPLLSTYRFPPFDTIRAEDFDPALDQLLASANEQLEAIRGDASRPDFENTVMAIEGLFAELVRVQKIVESYTNSNMSDAMADARRRVVERVDDFRKTVFQDNQLAKRFQSVALPDSEEDRTLHGMLFRSFESEGSFLSAADRKRLGYIDQELNNLCEQYMGNLRAAVHQQAVLFTDLEALAGLPEGLISAMRAAAQQAGHAEGWLLIPQIDAIAQGLLLADNRDTRQRILKAQQSIGTEAPYDNAPLIQKVQALRHERALLLGYANHNDYALPPTMAGNVAQVTAFMDGIAEKALPKFADNIRKIQAYASSQDGPRKLEPWDVTYWANRYQKEMLDFDGQKLAEYLPLDAALQGYFSTAERAFGVTFTENREYPRHDDDVRIYAVTDATTGKPVGILCADFFARSTKRDGAWCDQLQRTAPGQPNIVTLNMNLPKPQPGEPTLFQPDNMETLWHEGGHAIHGLLGISRHPRLQDIDETSSDYAEFFSTYFEKWPTRAEILERFARHYQTGEPVPAALLESMEKAQNFLAERVSLKIVQQSRRDFLFHGMDPADYVSGEDICQKVDFDHPLATHLECVPFTRFRHPFLRGMTEYASGYYGYVWSEAAAQHAHHVFASRSLFDPELNQRLRSFYEEGIRPDMQRAFSTFLGRPFDPREMADSLIASIGADKPSRVAASPAITGGRS